MGNTRRLVESIKLLALDASEQFQSLPKFVAVPDELASTFCDAYDAGRTQVDKVWDMKVVALCDQIRATFDEMTSVAREEFFTDNAVSADARWIEIRSNARAILRGLGVHLSAPDLEWIKYISDEPKA